MNGDRMYKVTLINLNTHEECGYEEGRTQSEAQNAALQRAWKIDPNASLSQHGTAVFFEDSGH